MVYVTGRKESTFFGKEKIVRELDLWKVREALVLYMLGLTYF